MVVSCALIALLRKGSAFLLRCMNEGILNDQRSRRVRGIISTMGKNFMRVG